MLGEQSQRAREPAVVPTKVLDLVHDRPTRPKMPVDMPSQANATQPRQSTKASQAIASNQGQRLRENMLQVSVPKGAIHEHADPSIPTICLRLGKHGVEVAIEV